MEDCERMGIEVVPPDVNLSDIDFSVGDGKIYFALSAIKGCGGSAAEAIVTARKQGGRFKDLFDFCERVDVTSCNRSTIETLIKAGAMDSFAARRAQLAAVVDRALQSGAAASADRRSGQKSLFGGLEDESERPVVTLPDVPEWEERERLLMEREVLGFYRSSHPLAEYEGKLSQFCSHSTADLAALPERAEVILGGMLSAIKFAHVKKTRPGATATKYANFDLEDKHGTIRCILWPEEFVTFGPLVQPDAVLLARGTIDRRGGDEANLIVSEMIPLDELDSRYTSGMIICLDELDGEAGALRTIREIVRGYPGDRDLFLLFSFRDGSRVQLKSNRLRVDITPELRSRVEDLLGPGHLRLIMSRPAPAQTKRSGNRRGATARNERG
jgi:DNA polymerase-3 subunit alpha